MFRRYITAFVTVLAIAAGTLSAQESATVTGVVRDDQGVTLPGASVMLRGTKIGVNTDIDGRYTIKLPAQLPDKPELQYSFIGMKTVTVSYKGQTRINVTLKNDATIEETVVTGYQTLKRRDVAGSVTSLKGEDVLMPSYTSIDQMLQGKVAGLVVQQTSSRVGSTPDLKIRGTSTIMGNTSPLWVVDGVIQPDPLELDQSSLLTDDLANILGNQISWLNPSDIETITVLRDASATAIYGSKASNGVIVITTKQGKTGKPVVKYTGSMSVRARPNYGMFNLMNSQERVKFSQEVFQAGSSYRGTIAPYKQLYTFEGVYRMYLDNELTADEYKDAYNYLETVNTDWFKILCRTSVSHSHNVSLSGGTEKVVYNASVAYSGNSGVEKGNDADKMSARVRVGAQLGRNVHLDVSIAGAIDKTYGYGPGVSPMAYATTTSRAIPAYDRDGNDVYYRYPSTYTYGELGLDLGYNILNEMENSYSKSSVSKLNATMDLTWDILPWLSYQFTGGLSNANTSAETYAGEKTYYIANNYRGYDYGAKLSTDPEYYAALIPFGGQLQQVSKTETNYNFQNKILFHKTIKEHHRLNAMAAMEIRSTRYDSNQNTVWGYMPERGKKLSRPTTFSSFQSMNTSSLTEFGIFENIYRGAWSNHGSEDNYVSVMGTLSYSYRNRYVVNLSIRNDMSNRFGQDVNRRFDPLYSVAASWDVTEEPWLKDRATWLDQLRLRASYGIQGNTIQSISPDMIVAHQGVVSQYNQYGVSIRSLPNPELTWESTMSWNVGLDLQLLKWITGTVEYYYRVSDAIVYQSVAREYGMSSLALNGGRVSNYGIEAAVNITPIQKKDVTWTVGFNASNNWNSAVNIDSSLDQVSDYLYGASGRILKVGYPISGFWSYAFKGLNPENGYPEFYNMDKSTTDPTEFLVYTGQTDPTFTGGFNTRIRWREFTFGADFTALLGASKRLVNPFTSDDRLPQPYVNMSRELLNRWKNPGDEATTNIPAFYSGGSSSYITLPNGSQESMYTMWGYSDVRVVNASFLRCTQMSLQWQAPQTVTKALRISDLMCSFTVSNIFVICSKAFQGFDPELGDSVMPRIFSFGLNLGF